MSYILQQHHHLFISDKTNLKLSYVVSVYLRLVLDYLRYRISFQRDMKPIP